jgi:hypothetical protein
MKRIFTLFLLTLCLSVHSQDIESQSAGLNFQTYAAGGATPSYTQDANGNITNRTLLSSGVVSTINYNWGSGGVLNSGRSEGVIVRFYGFINITTAGTYWFGGNADDGIRINVNNISVVNSWIESGGDFRQGSISLSAGVVPIEVLYYENGGGALVNLQWFINGSWQITPSTSLTTTAPQEPVLCCGGSSTQFSADINNTTKVNTFTNRTTADSQVYVEQIGNDNNIIINQSGTKNNYAKYSGNGNNNDININQSGNATTLMNYVDLTVIGNQNFVGITQQSTGGAKGAFVNISDNNNTMILQQKDGGSHYADINLIGGYKNVDVTQQGSASHMAKVTLSGQPTDLSLTQTGSTQQHYSINFNCATTGGCAKITVQQGQ